MDILTQKILQNIMVCCIYVSSYGKKSIDVYQCYPGGKYVRHVNIINVS